MKNFIARDIYQIGLYDKDLVDVVNKYEPLDTWGEINRVTFHFYDTSNGFCIFQIDCSGHGGYVAVAPRGMLKNATFKYDILGNRSMYLFEEDCDYSVLLNQIKKEYMEIIEEDYNKEATRPKTLREYARDTLARYYPNININL